MANPIFAVYAFYWTEYESGWGSRPDGASYHASIEEANAYVKAYWDNMPSVAPECYDAPDSKTPVLVAVKKDFYDKVQEEKSIRVWRATMKEVEIPK